MPIATLLLVEDEPITAHDLVQVIAKLGYHLLATCATRAEAMQIMETAAIDLVLLDLHLGTESLEGIALARWISHYHSSQIIIVSGYLNHPELCSLGGVAISDYLAKPFHPLNLDQAIVRALGRPPRAPLIEMARQGLVPLTMEEGLVLEGNG
ncbi:MAG: response regulator [Candidatus Pacebacteria bacterium]|nr:response regulator [Candidatus Paceibacterota bacterium]